VTRTLILNGAVADARQIKAFDSSNLADTLIGIQGAALSNAQEDPSMLVLGRDGLSPLESSIVPLAFEALVAGLWDEIVAAYLRGAGEDNADLLPAVEEILDRSADDLAELLDGMQMRGLREQLHERAWSYASKVAQQARRVAALSGGGNG
jgi:hypothetical protein